MQAQGSPEGARLLHSSAMMHQCQQCGSRAAMTNMDMFG